MHKQICKCGLDGKVHFTVVMGVLDLIFRLHICILYFLFPHILCSFVSVFSKL